MTQKYGPTLPISEEIHKMKYRDEGETFIDCQDRLVSTLCDNPEHKKALKDIFYNQRFMPAGRVQSNVGSPKRATPYNCFVSGNIEDSFSGILDKAKEAGQTMRMGGGIGYDFSSLRPRGALIKSLGSKSSGPVSFMNIYDSICGTVASSGHRRGAQMGVLRIDHPDILEFINAKQNETALRNFNISVGVTDEFMEALSKGEKFDLKFDGEVYATVDSKELWNKIMRSTWDWAEPGILFIDRINQMNNLYYCEEIVATNPCGEQPLPPYGACLLGSFNLVKYVYEDSYGDRFFNYTQFRRDIPHVVRAMDNVVDEATYPLEAQEREAKSKRRMGLGLTGVANALEFMGLPYGSDGFLKELERILRTLRDFAYLASADLAEEKGSFPLYDKAQYLSGEFIKSLSDRVRMEIERKGIRNSHLLSIAPTGTISLSADNISSGIEPVFTHSYTRTIQTFDGPFNEEVTDYAYREWKLKGRTAAEVSVEEHVKVLNLCQKYVDSSVSKTCNVGSEVTWDQFKDIYMHAWNGGAKGCTTFRAAGKRYGILNETKEEPEEVEETEGGACYYDLETGQKSCS